MILLVFYAILILSQKMAITPIVRSLSILLARRLMILILIVNMCNTLILIAMGNK